MLRWNYTLIAFLSCLHFYTFFQFFNIKFSVTYWWIALIFWMFIIDEMVHVLITLPTGKSIACLSYKSFYVWNLSQNWSFSEKKLKFFSAMPFNDCSYIKTSFMMFLIIVLNMNEIRSRVIDILMSKKCCIFHSLAAILDAN